MYLAIVSCTMDDIPIRLTHTKEAARDALDTCTEAEFERAAAAVALDATSIVCGRIVELDEDGRPRDAWLHDNLPHLEANCNTDD